MIQKNKLKTVIVIVLLLIPVSSFASQDNYLLHVGLSSIFGAAGESYLHYKTDLGITKRIIYGTIIGSVPGFAKEVMDSRKENNYFSGTQMLANVAGAFLGSVIANHINEKIQINIDNRGKKTTISLLYKFW